MSFAFDHIHVASSNVREAVEFYTKALGARIIGDQMVVGQRTVDLDIGGTLVRVSTIAEAEEPYQIKEPPPEPTDEPRFGLHHFALLVDNLREMTTELKCKGVEFVAEPTQHRPGLWYAVISAPDKVRIELLEKSES